MEITFQLHLMLVNYYDVFFIRLNYMIHLCYAVRIGQLLVTFFHNQKFKNDALFLRNLIAVISF